jgi:hypothetical protein
MFARDPAVSSEITFLMSAGVAHQAESRRSSASWICGDFSPWPCSLFFAVTNRIGVMAVAARGRGLAHGPEPEAPPVTD